MATDPITNLAGQLKTGAQDTGTVLLFIAAGILIIGVIWIIWYIRSFKNQVVIRIQTKNGKYIFHEKSKKIIKEGVPYWRLFRTRRDVTPPPPESIEVTKKGRYYAECYMSDDNPDPIWLHDSGNGDLSFEPFTMQERALHVERITRATERRKKGWLEILAQLAMPLAFVILIVCVFVFWGELSKPTVLAAQANAQTSDNIMKITEQQARISSVLAGQADAKTLLIQQTITPEKT